jgi:hypothetical protein
MSAPIPKIHLEKVFESSCVWKGASRETWRIKLILLAQEAFQ